MHHPQMIRSSIDFSSPTILQSDEYKGIVIFSLLLSPNAEILSYDLNNESREVLESYFSNETYQYYVNKNLREGDAVKTFVTHSRMSANRKMYPIEFIPEMHEHIMELFLSGNSLVNSWTESSMNNFLRLVRPVNSNHNQGSYLSAGIYLKKREILTNSGKKKLVYPLPKAEKLDTLPLSENLSFHKLTINLDSSVDNEDSPSRVTAWCEPHRCNGKTKILSIPIVSQQKFLRDTEQMCMEDSNLVNGLLSTNFDVEIINKFDVFYSVDLLRFLFLYFCFDFF